MLIQDIDMEWFIVVYFFVKGSWIEADLLGKEGWSPISQPNYKICIQKIRKSNERFIKIAEYRETELDIKFEEHPWDASEFYWTIFADAGNIRSDLIRAIEEVGFKCYQHFDAENEEFEVKEIQTFDAEPSI